MELEYTYGCICDSLTINDKETIDIPIDTIKDVIQELLYSETDLAVIQDILISLITSQGTYECSDKPCECCGDYITTYTLEI